MCLRHIGDAGGGLQFHPGSGAAGCQSGWDRRGSGFRQVETGRHTAETPGYQSPPAIGMATKDPPGRWSSGYLSMVFTEFRRVALISSKIACGGLVPVHAMLKGFPSAGCQTAQMRRIGIDLIMAVPRSQELPRSRAARFEVRSARLYPGHSQSIALCAPNFAIAVRSWSRHDGMIGWLSPPQEHVAAIKARSSPVRDHCARRWSE